MLSRIDLRDFRCFPTLGAEFAAGRNIFIGENAQGKTSLLEAICVLLRLQSPRVAGLAPAVRHGGRGFVLDGYFDRRHLQFYFSRQRKKLALDSVEQTSAAAFLGIARVVWFSNQDIEIVRGSGEQRRAFLDFVAGQIDPGYLPSLRAYRRALRSRNHLLKAPRPVLREIRAFDLPLAKAGAHLLEARAALIESLRPLAADAHAAITSQCETIELAYLPGAAQPLSEALEASRDEDLRLRQTTVGPHRDDFRVALDGIGTEFASEGQQRTVALAAKLSQARLIATRSGISPVLLLDDIFGELDPVRRNALLAYLPADSQQFITTTHLDWMAGGPDDTRILRLGGGRISPP